jgi:hypothetical protein
MLLFNEGSFQAHWLDRSRAALEAEIWTLRQQINVLERTAPKRLSFSVFDHLVFVGLYRLFSKICDALAIVQPDTIVRWHRAQRLTRDIRVHDATRSFGTKVCSEIGEQVKN